jgi:hypothetical protein
VRLEGGIQLNPETKTMARPSLRRSRLADLREMMREALEFNGYTVAAAAEGQSALDRIDASKPLMLDRLLSVVREFCAAAPS